MKRILRKLIPWAILCSGSLTGPVFGAVLAAIDSGWYRGLDGGSSKSIVGPSDIGYFTGKWNQPGVGQQVEYRGFVVFDLAGISGTILSATLALDNPAGDGSLGPATVGNPLLALFSVTTPAATVSGTSPSFAVFNDLGDGPSYGSLAVSGSGLVTIPLNATAIAQLTAAEGGKFVIGLAVTNPDGPDNYLFTYSEGTLRQLTLVLAAPEPASFVPLTASLLMLGFFLQRRAGTGRERP